MSCPVNSFSFNSTCICNPGFYFLNGVCQTYNVLDVSGSPVPEISSFSFQPKLKTSIYESNEGVSQTIFLIVTLSILGVWIGGTLFLRVFPLRGVFFTLRRYVSLVDYAFSKKHWIDEQKVQVKRKTELGGMLSIGAFIFIIGICLGIVWNFFLLDVNTVQNIIPTNGRDVAEFKNDLTFNFTVISSMKCSQFTPLPFIITGSSDTTYRFIPTADLVSVTCYDTEKGPLISTLCSDCQISFDNYYNVFQFRDLPEQGLYAMAVGFEFSVSTTGRKGGVERKSLVSGRVQGGSNGNSSEVVTLRGPPSDELTRNLFKFRFVPRVFEKDDNLQLMQTAFHEYVAGNRLNSSEALAASLRNASHLVELVVNTEVLSAYLVSTTLTPRIGILTFLSRIGGIYQLGILLFFWSLNMSERYIPFLRYDDKLLNRLERQRLARYRWRKLRVAVKYGLLTGSLGGTKDRGAGVTEPGETEGPEDVPSLGSASLAAGKGGLFGSLRGGLSVRRLENLGKSVRGEAKGLLPRYGVPAGKEIEVSQSMERQARQEVQQKIPDAKLPDCKPDLPSTIIPSKDPNSLPEVQPHIAERVGQSLVAGIRATGHAAQTAGKALSYVASGGRPAEKGVDGLPPNPELPPVMSSEDVKSLGGSEEKGEKKKKKKRDTRLGSTSEHVGSFIRKFRNPSWIPDYKMLPAVPDVSEKVKELTGEAEDERAGHAVTEEEERQKLELYNYLIELHDYQARLREDFLAAQTMLENVVQRFRPHSDL